MDATQICPGCQVRLVVRDRVRTEFITCPRCLTPVANPHRAAGAAPAAPARRAVTVGVPLCTVCAEVLPGHASNCPAGPNRRSESAWSAPAADREASSDSNGTYVLALILAGMVLVGTLQTFGFVVAVWVALFLLGAVFSGGKESALGNVAKLIMGLLVTGLVITGLCIVAVLIMCGGMAGKIGKY